jgi:hypothetical protein
VTIILGERYAMSSIGWGQLSMHDWQQLGAIQSLGSVKDINVTLRLTDLFLRDKRKLE